MVGVVILYGTQVLFSLAIDVRKISKAARRTLNAPRAMADVSLREISSRTRSGLLEVAGDLSEWLGDAQRIHEIEIIPLDVAMCGSVKANCRALSR